MKTDTAKTKPKDRSNENEQDAKARWDGEGGTPARHLPRKRSRKVLHAWIVAASLIAIGAVPQGRAQSPNGAQSPASFGDAVITELVTNSFGSDRALTGTDISILTVGRVVYLRGLANTLKQVDRAGTLARRVEGVSAVSNAIRISDRPSRA